MMLLFVAFLIIIVGFAAVDLIKIALGFLRVGFALVAFIGLGVAIWLDWVQSSGHDEGGRRHEPGAEVLDRPAQRGEI